MKLSTLNEVLPQALEGHYAVGHFNINGILWTEAFLETAQAENSPLILATSDRVVDYLGGFNTIRQMVDYLLKQLKIDIPVVLHLDHGQTIDRCKKAIDNGYSSVMYDGSAYSIDENIKQTKVVSDYAHQNGCSIEAEVGAVGGSEDGIVGGIKYAKLKDCQRIVEEARVDALAAALGSVHGQYVGEPKLGFTEMEAISATTETPLVLHGASGIPEEQIKKAISLGHSKINVNTEFNMAWVDGLREVLSKEQSIYEPRKVQKQGKEKIKNVAKQKIYEFGSQNKA